MDGFVTGWKIDHMDYSIWRLPRIQEELGLSKSTIYQKISDGRFPKQISLGGRAVGWLKVDIQNWVKDCLAESKIDD